MTMHYEGPHASRRAPEYEDPYQRLDTAAQERYGFGYQTYYMRRLIALDWVRFAKKSARESWVQEDKVRHLETAEHWEQILLRYCEPDILALETAAAQRPGLEWMEEVNKAMVAFLESYSSTFS